MRLSSLVLTIALSSQLFAGANRWTATPIGTATISSITAGAEDGSFYACTPAGIYRSDDGLHWRAINEGLQDPGDVRAFVATKDWLFAAIGTAVFGSPDRGEHWLRRSLVNADVTALAFDAATSTLLAGTDAGVYYSADAGESWLTPQMPTRLGFVQTIVTSSDGALLQGDLATANNGTLRSVDGGRTWEIEPTVTFSLYADPRTQAVYGSAGPKAFVSFDAGRSWSKLPSLSVGFILAIVPVGYDAYAATDRGMYEFRGQTNQWIAIGGGELIGAAVTDSSPRRIVGIVPNAGLVAMTEGHPAWSAANDGLPGKTAFDIAISDPDPAVAYAATVDGIFRTDDGGENWTGPKARANRVSFAPKSSETAYAIGTTLLKTVDGGTTWTSVIPAPGMLFDIARSDPATIYATLSAGISRSTDGGASWSSITAGIAADFYDAWYGFQASSLAVDPTDASTVYLGRPTDLYKTIDGGATWNIAAHIPYLGSLTIDRADPQTMYAAAFSGGMVKSVDGGKTWQSAGLTTTKIASVALDQSRIYAASSDGHVYVSDDGGRSWNGFDEGLHGARIWGIAANENRIYVATDASIYRNEVVDQDIRPKRQTTPLRLPQPGDGGFVLPILGSASGAEHTSYTSDVTLTNSGESAQNLLVAWLPQSGGAEPAASFALTVPAGVTAISDVMQLFGINGIGALAFLPVDDAGNADPKASIDGSARIWTHLDGGRAPISQSIASVRDLSADATQRTIAGLRHDSAFRSNVGIVNLSSDAQGFTIAINGERASRLITLSVPPLSLVQVPLPDDDYGTLSVDATSDAPAAWVLFGSAIDRSTLAAQTLNSLGPKVSPPPPAPANEVWVYGNVIDSASGSCIDGATIQVVGDPRPGSRSINQCGQPFNANFKITGMEDGTSVTMRVYADGYMTREFPIAITGDIDGVMIVTFGLTKQ